MSLVRAEPAEEEPPEAQSITELFAAMESPLLAYALRLLGERAPAEDVVQEAFMKLHTHFDEVLEPRPWLYRTVHNLALNHLRRASKVVPLPKPGEDEGGEPPSPALLPDEEMARCEGIELVRQTVEDLDERSRELVRLKFNEDLSYKEISARTGLTVGHVGYLLHHALKTVANKLTRGGLLP